MLSSDSSLKGSRTPLWTGCEHIGATIEMPHCNSRYHTSSLSKLQEAVTPVKQTHMYTNNRHKAGSRQSNGRGGTINNIVLSIHNTIMDCTGLVDPTPIIFQTKSKDQLGNVLYCRLCLAQSHSVKMFLDPTPAPCQAHPESQRDLESFSKTWTVGTQAEIWTFESIIAGEKVLDPYKEAPENGTQS